MDTLCLVASPVGFSSFEWPCSLHFLSVHYCLCSGKLDEVLTSVLSVSESPSRHIILSHIWMSCFIKSVVNYFIKTQKLMSL